MAANHQRLLTASLLTMYMKPPHLDPLSFTPCRHVYASPVFMVISDHSSLGVSRSPQSTNKPDCCSQHRFIPPNVIIPAFSHCSCLFYIPAHSLPFISSPLCLIPDTSLCLFSYPDLSEFPSMLAWCHFAKGIWRDDQVKMMCPPRCGCIILNPQQFRWCLGTHLRQCLMIQGLFHCWLSTKIGGTNAALVNGRVQKFCCCCWTSCWSEEDGRTGL